MRVFFLACAMLAAIRASAARAPCGAPVHALRLDHAVVVVRDLDAAEARFRRLGFRVKPGHVHSDNLSNRHVKFRDHAEIELMSLAGPPTDPMARDYAALLTSGEGGAYAALWTDDLAAVEAAAQRTGLSPHVTRDGDWTFLGFPGDSDAGAIFVGTGGSPPVDSESVLAHENGAVGLDDAWVGYGPRLVALLKTLGGTPCSDGISPDGQAGLRFWMRSGSLVLVLPGNRHSPSLVGVTLRRRDPADGPQALRPFPAFWIVIR